jgi:hypothetical protein
MARTPHLLIGFASEYMRWKALLRGFPLDGVLSTTTHDTHEQWPSHLLSPQTQFPDADHIRTPHCYSYELNYPLDGTSRTERTALSISIHEGITSLSLMGPPSQPLESLLPPANAANGNTLEGSFHYPHSNYLRCSQSPSIWCRNFKALRQISQPCPPPPPLCDTNKYTLLAGVTVVPNCTTMRAGLLIAQLPQLGMWMKRDSKMKAIFEFSVVFMQV